MNNVPEERQDSSDLPPTTAKLAGRSSLPTPTGILLIDKPAKRAVSSVTVCRKVKRSLRAAGFDVSKIKVGHAGTLDPLASGLLIVLVGRAATRMCNTLMDGPKTYVATIDLLRSSPSDDLETPATINDLQRRPTREEIEVAFGKFRGVIQQRPPAYSAIWIDGVRSFKLARKASLASARAEDEKSSGGLHEIEPRPVTIHRLELLEYDWPYVTIEVECSKGTYIRSLARDLGVAISGFAAVLTQLRRTAIGRFRVENATELERLPEQITQQDLLSITTSSQHDQATS